MTMKAKITEIPAAREKAPEAAIDATVENLKTGASKAMAGYQTTQTKMKEGMEKTMKTAEELVAFNQGNMEAVVKSGQIWATGLQDLSKHIASAAQASMEESISTFRALTGVQSLKDAFDLQTNFARSQFEKTLTESGKLTDASLKLTEQTLAPLTARVNVAVERLAKVA